MNDLAPIIALNVNKQPQNGRMLHGNMVNGSTIAQVALSNRSIVSRRLRGGSPSCG